MSLREDTEPLIVKNKKLTPIKQYIPFTGFSCEYWKVDEEGNNLMKKIINTSNDDVEIFLIFSESIMYEYKKQSNKNKEIINLFINNSTKVKTRNPFNPKIISLKINSIVEEGKLNNKEIACFFPIKEIIDPEGVYINIEDQNLFIQITRDPFGIGTWGQLYVSIHVYNNGKYEKVFYGDNVLFYNDNNRKPPKFGEQREWIKSFYNDKKIFKKQEKEQKKLRNQGNYIDEDFTDLRSPLLVEEPSREEPSREESSREESSNSNIGGRNLYKYKGRSYKIHIGKRGGKYINVKGSKKYI